LARKSETPDCGAEAFNCQLPQHDRAIRGESATVNKQEPRHLAARPENRPVGAAWRAGTIVLGAVGEA